MSDTTSKDDGLRRVPDWQWLTEILSDFDIFEKRSMRKNARDFTSLEARLYRDIQNRYKPRKKANYIVTDDGGRTSKQYKDAKRIHADQINTMNEMGYGLMLDGFTFYKYGHELEPYDFETNFNMHQAYEIHKLIKQYGIQERREYAIKGADAVLEDLRDWMNTNDHDLRTLRNHITTMTGSVALKVAELTALKAKGGEE